jgi:hypothetical protein
MLRFSLPVVVITESIEIIVSISVIVFRFANIQFNRVETDHFQVEAAFLTGYNVALLGFGINIYFFLTFGTGCARHLIYLQRIVVLKFSEVVNLLNENLTFLNIILQETL